jgi:hypothetical protein
MMVVIGLVALMAAMALPSIVSLMNAGADAQAYNLIAAQLTFARSLAIERVNYAGVHCQVADAKDSTGLLRPKQQDVCYSGIVFVDDSNGFTSPTKLFTGYNAPKQVPGGIGFGKVCTAMSGDGATVGTDEKAPYTSDAGTQEKFTTFTVLFTSTGTAVKSVDGQTVRFWTKDPLFLDNPKAADIAGSRKLWELTNADDHFAVTAMCLFEMRRYAPVSPADRISYLNDNAQFLPLNNQTGQLYIRE